MDSSKPTYIKNRLGDVITYSLSDGAVHNTPYIGSITINKYINALKYYSLDNDAETVTSYMNPSFFQTLKTCSVTINDTTYSKCPILWYSTPGESVEYIAQGTRISCYIGNPKFLFEFWKGLSAGVELPMELAEEDNGLPFLIPFDMYDANPIGNSNFFCDLEF
jgi:hypothetical protein